MNPAETTVIPFSEGSGTTVIGAGSSDPPPPKPPQPQETPAEEQVKADPPPAKMTAHQEIVVKMVIVLLRAAEKNEETLLSGQITKTIAEELGISRTNVSPVLKIMESQGMIIREPQGKQYIIRLSKNYVAPAPAESKTPDPAPPPKVALADLPTHPEDLYIFLWGLKDENDLLDFSVSLKEGICENLSISKDRMNAILQNWRQEGLIKRLGRTGRRGLGSAGIIKFLKAPVQPVVTHAAIQTPSEPPEPPPPLPESEPPKVLPEPVLAPPIERLEFKTTEIFTNSGQFSGLVKVQILKTIEQMREQIGPLEDEVGRLEGIIAISQQELEQVQVELSAARVVFQFFTTLVKTLFPE
jgi:biotin operon repressor